MPHRPFSIRLNCFLRTKPCRVPQPCEAPGTLCSSISLRQPLAMEIDGRLRLGEPRASAQPLHWEPSPAANDAVLRMALLSARERPGHRRPAEAPPRINNHSLGGDGFGIWNQSNNRGSSDVACLVLTLSQVFTHNDGRRFPTRCFSRLMLSYPQSQHRSKQSHFPGNFIPHHLPGASEQR